MPQKDKDKVILKVDMHCEACKASVRKSLRDMPGVENIEINMNEQKVIVNGKVDAGKVLDRVRKRSGRRTELLFPQLPMKDVEIRKEDVKTEALEITVILKVKMHCRGCAKKVTRSLQKIDGVSSVEVDRDAAKVIVTGRNIDPKIIWQQVVKKTRKHVEVVMPQPLLPKIEEPAEGNKEEKKEEIPAAEEKKEEIPAEEKEEQPAAGAQEQMEEKPAEETAGEVKEEAKDEKKEEGAEKEAKPDVADSEQEEGGDNGNNNLKRFRCTPVRSIPDYVHPPQLFSDENPNACTVM